MKYTKNIKVACEYVIAILRIIKLQSSKYNVQLRLLLTWDVRWTTTDWIDLIRLLGPNDLKDYPKVDLDIIKFTTHSK